MAELRVEKVDSASYARFLSDNPPDNPYSLPPILEAYRDAFSCEFELLSVFRKETPIASCALFVGRRFFQPLVRLLPIRAYDGVHFRKIEDSKIQKQEYEKLIALQVLEQFMEKNFSFHQMVFQPGFEDVRAFRWAGARVIPQYTYVVDMEAFSEENYTKSLKEVLRAAERSGLKCAKCGVEELIALQRLSYERHGRSAPVSSDRLRQLMSKLSSAGLLEINCVRSDGGDVLAALARLQTDTASYFYVSGTNAEGEKGASHLLYDEILKLEKKAGRTFVDFCGANTPSINLFKSAFGPRLEIHFRIWRANRLGTRLASLLKKI